jgi:hypothetical protein
MGYGDGVKSRLIQFKPAEGMSYEEAAADTFTDHMSANLADGGGDGFEHAGRVEILESSDLAMCPISDERLIDERGREILMLRSCRPCCLTEMAVGATRWPYRDSHR